MDSVRRSSSVTPRKSRLVRSFAKVLNIQAVTGVAPDDGMKSSSQKGDLKSGVVKSFLSRSFEEEEELQDRAVTEAFLARLFASISAIKASYALLQQAQTPYDPDGIQSADEIVVTELKSLSELKHSYLKRQFYDGTSPETARAVAEIEEQKNLLKTYEVMGKKLDSQVKLKDSEITFLMEKLEDVRKENKSLQKRLNSVSPSSLDWKNLRLSDLTPTHFVALLKQAVKSVRVFVRLLISEMESVGWDVDAAASSIMPGVRFLKPNDRCFAFESFVCREIFSRFAYPYFSKGSHSQPGEEVEDDDTQRRQTFFNRFLELKSVKPMDHLIWKPNSAFSKFCRANYSRVLHPKVEESIFGNLNQRDLLEKGEYPETPFFSTFAEMAKRVWLLHCLAFSLDNQASAFQVSEGNRFSEVYMESVNDEVFALSREEPRVAFTVFPGFRISKTVIQCHVYLR